MTAVRFPWICEFEEQGHAVIAGLVDEARLDDLAGLFDELGDRAGTRDGLRHAVIRGLVSSPELTEVVSAILGRQAVAVRATLFDKTRAVNWRVPWHQDLMVPVSKGTVSEVPGFNAWSSKQGITYAKPPVEILEQALAMRIDVDGTDADRGGLRVLPASHRYGILEAEDIHRLRQDTAARECRVPRGGALLMRPLLLHASSRSVAPVHRRILHIEFHAAELPQGLEWYESVPVSPAADRRGSTD